jgi:hypothetical protein
MVGYMFAAVAVNVPLTGKRILKADFESSLFLPFVLFAVFTLVQSRQPPQPLSTDKSLQNIITDITIIQSLLPRFPRSPSISLPKLLRVVAICYLPYLILTFFVSLQVIFAIAGTLILSWRAPWAIVIRTTVWHSAWFRWSIYKLWSRISGDRLPPPTISPQSLSDSLAPVQSLRFLFSIYENQRWWVGLDWTAVLLPAERPSWCSASHLPLSPPNAFTLPENTTIYLPDAKGNRMKRTAVWKWEEPEWRVLVRTDGSGVGLTRVERPFPTVKDDTPNSNRFLKVATGRGGLLGPEIPKNTASGNADEDSITPDSEGTVDEDLTDSDGWVYGDNKWENQSNRGVMGKYTRYRRWTRIAAVCETVELDLGTSIAQFANELETPTMPIPVDQSSSSQHAIPDMPSTDESPLRQRLRMALNKGSTM